MTLDWAGEPPSGRALGGESEKAAVIFGIADQHQRSGRAGPLGNGEHVRHQRMADAPLLARGIDSDRPDHRQPGSGTIVAGERHWPALDRADQLFPVEGGEAQSGNRAGTLADGISGAPVTIASKCAIEQLLDRGGLDFDKGYEPQHRHSFDSERERFRVDARGGAL